MIKPNPAVPQRIPKLLSQRIDLPVLAVMDQDKIDVRAGAELPAGKRPNSGQRNTLRRTAGLVIERYEF
jgi:hypothetical protein